MSSGIESSVIANPYPEFGPFSSAGFALFLVLFSGSLLFFFFALPSVDIAVSNWFFDRWPCPGGEDAKEVCGSFFLGKIPWLRNVRQFIQYLPAFVAVVLGAVFFVLHRRNPQSDKASGIVAATAIATLLIGPGLIVNGLLKPNSGRPRPRETDLFGGDLPFVPAGEMTDHCASNCSFVSGESSAVFWLLCLIPMIPSRYRAITAVAVISIAVFGSMMRVASGGHYFSDILLGALVTLVSYALLANIVARWIPIRN